MKMSNMRYTTIGRGWGAAALFTAVLAIAIGGGIWAALPSQNGDGASLTQLSGEIWSGGGQANAAGGVLEIAGSFDESVETVNGEGATAYLGHLDPGELNPSSVRPTWRLYR